MLLIDLEGSRMLVSTSRLTLQPPYSRSRCSNNSSSRPVSEER